MIDLALPSFHNMTLFGFCLITPVKLKKGIARSGGEGTLPHLINFLYGESSGVGEWYNQTEHKDFDDGIYCRN